MTTTFQGDVTGSNPSVVNDTIRDTEKAREVLNLGIAIGSSWERFNDEFKATIEESEEIQLRALQEKCSDLHTEWQGAEFAKGDYLEKLHYKYGFLAGMEYQKALQEKAARE